MKQARGPAYHIDLFERKRELYVRWNLDTTHHPYWGRDRNSKRCKFRFSVQSQRAPTYSCQMQLTHTTWADCTPDGVHVLPNNGSEMAGHFVTSCGVSANITRVLVNHVPCGKYSSLTIWLRSIGISIIEVLGFAHPGVYIVLGSGLSPSPSLSPSQILPEFRT